MPPLGGPIAETHTCQEQNKNFVRNSRGELKRRMTAGEDQQQFQRSTEAVDCETVSPAGKEINAECEKSTLLEAETYQRLVKTCYVL
jgi:hypothetical protein